MITLTIQGEKPEQFYLDAIKTLTILIGAAKRAQPAPAGDTTPAPATGNAGTTGRVVDDICANKPDPFPAGDKVGEIAEPLANPSATEAPPELKPRGRKSKKTETIEPEKPAAADEGGIPEFLQRTEPKAETKPAVTVTMEMCREQMRKSFEAFETRERAKLGRPATEADEKAIMLAKVEFHKPLIYGFGVKTVAALPEEKWVEFYEKSQAYIEGRA